MTADEVGQKMDRRAAMVEKKFRSTAQGIASSAVAFTKGLMTEQIYALPEDRTKQGEARFQKQRAAGGRRRPFIPRKGDRKWVRTGHLRRSETAEIRDPYTVAIINTAAYSIPRHEAGKPGRRKINPARESHWRDELLEKFQPLLHDLYHDTIEDIHRNA